MTKYITCRLSRQNWYATTALNDIVTDEINFETTIKDIEIAKIEKKIWIWKKLHFLKLNYKRTKTYVNVLIGVLHVWDSLGPLIFTNKMVN